MGTRDITDTHANTHDDVLGDEAAELKRPHTPTFTKTPHASPLSPSDTIATQHSTKPPLVTPHAKHPNWDDFPQLNRTYENPYYVEPIDNFLWLPRNPFGVLDLDDSVDLHEPLTTEPGGGQLGQWVNDGIDPQTRLPPGSVVETPSSIPESLSRESVRSGFPFRLERQHSGTEEITMSPVLSARVAHIEQEDQVERASPPRRPNGWSNLGPRPGSSDRRPSTGGRRPSVLSGGAPIAFIGRSASGSPSAQQRRPSFSTAMSVRRPSPSRTYDPVNEPDLQAEAAFIDSPLGIPLSTRNTAGSRLSDQQETSQGPSVAMHDAVVSEIIAEEHVEAMDRIRREEEEQRAVEKQTPSWWTAWLWNRSGPPAHRASETGGAGG